MIGQSQDQKERCGSAHFRRILLLPWVVVVCLTCLSGSGAAASSPRTESPPLKGLVLWLDAGDIDAEGRRSTMPQHEEAISVWKDRSGKGNDVSQNVVEHQPAYHSRALGGRPVVRFDGNDMLDRAMLAGFRAGDQAFHVVLVMKARREGTHPNPRVIDFQAAQGRFSDVASIRRNGLWVGYQGNGKNRLGIYNGDEGESGSIAWDDRAHLVEAVYSGSQKWIHLLDGRKDGEGRFRGNTFTGFAGGSKLALGQHYGRMEGRNSFFKGDLAEVFVYQRVLSANEQNTLGLYLERKYHFETAYSPQPQFETDVLPLLAKNCTMCHGAESKEGDLDLRSLAGMLRGGKSGPAIVRGSPEQSKLLYLVSSGKMPPEQDDQFSPNQVMLIRRWIQGGAPSRKPVGKVRPRELVSAEDRRHWAFRKIRKVTPPQVKNLSHVRTPVDRFILSRLEKHRLTFSNDAGRAALIRRAYFDLIGLPPTPQDVAAFQANKSPRAYEDLIDRLLVSPHFGERWGRHWLDEAGYADTFGSDIDAPGLYMGKGGKWRYRDYVIHSFNEDKTFDQFLTEQLAGDELVDWRHAERWTSDVREKLIATGFLRSAADDTDQDVLNTLDLRYDVLQRTGEILVSNLLALTIGCSKCHNHKYEPIPQRDYYRLMSFIQPAYNPQAWLQPVKRALPGLSEAERRAIDSETQNLQGRLEKIWAPYRQRLADKKFAQLPKPIRADTRTALRTPIEKRNEVQKQLAERFGKLVEVTSKEIQAALDGKDRTIDTDISQRLAELKKRYEAAGIIQVIYDVGPPSPTRLLYRGDERIPQEVVAPGFFTVLSSSEQESRLSKVEPRNGSSGRRLALARWFTKWDGRSGALVARVRVNRIWQRLFGKGIVPTSGNFGQSGQPPTHPELLEWLTKEFVRKERRLKPFIKLLMTSTVYRQSSSRSQVIDAHSAAASAGRQQGRRSAVDPRIVDPGNKLLWRMRLRRLESEIVRDAILAVSGKLDRTMGGPPLMLKNYPDGRVSLKTEGASDPSRTGRRSIYVLARRNYNLSILSTFDQPSMSMNCVERTYSAVVSQSLTMLNDEFVIQHANNLATRLTRDPALKSSEQRICRAFQIVLSRPPADKELSWSLGLLESHRQLFRSRKTPPNDVPQRVFAELCQMLLNTNEFLYVQ